MAVSRVRVRVVSRVRVRVVSNTYESWLVVIHKMSFLSQ